MNTPRNLAAEVAWSVLNKLQPKHCPPKMGEIEVDHGSVLQRVRVKKAFGGMKNHIFVFTKQSKGGFPMNQSKTSDSYFNRWRCEPLPLNQMLLIDDAQIPKCFPTDVVGASEFADEEVTEGYSMLVDEDQTLIGGKSFPFPLEFHASLTEAMLTTFGADVLVAMRPSSGECFKAVLRKRCWGVGICSSKEHKKLIRDRLMMYTRQMHLVDLKDAPQKPQELIVWESKRRSADQIGPVGSPRKNDLSFPQSASPRPAADPKLVSGFGASAASPAASPPKDADPPMVPIAASLPAPQTTKPKLFSFGSATL